jgi:hypothetical protein
VLATSPAACTCKMTAYDTFSYAAEGMDVPSLDSRARPRRHRLRWSRPFGQRCGGLFCRRRAVYTTHEPTCLTRLLPGARETTVMSKRYSGSIGPFALCDHTARV